MQNSPQNLVLEFAKTLLKRIKKPSFIVLVGIFLLAGLLRIYKFDSVPRTGATFDEFAWTWLGMSLLDGEQPTSWSPHSLYQERKQVQYLGAYFLIVTPYLEHPPLFGIIAGGFAKLNGVSDIFLVTTYKIRPLAIVMGMTSVLLLLLYIKRVYEKNVAVLAMLLFATVPTVVIGSKIVQNENFFVPMWLLSLLLLHQYIGTKKIRYKYLSFIVAGVLPLAKIPWLIGSFSLALILSYNKKWKDAAQAIIVGFIFLSLFVVYGMYYDADLFFNLFRFQLARYDISFAGIYSLLTDPLLLDRGYVDGWIFMGWFAIFYLAMDIKKHYWIVLPFFSYFILYAFAIPNEPGHGWYRYPFYPFTLSALAIVFEQQYKKTSLFFVISILFISLAILSNTWVYKFGFSYTVMRIVILLACGSFLLPLWVRKFEIIRKPLFIFWIALLILGNIWSVLGFIE